MMAEIGVSLPPAPGEISFEFSGLDMNIEEHLDTQGRRDGGVSNEEEKGETFVDELHETSEDETFDGRQANDQEQTNDCNTQSRRHKVLLDCMNELFDEDHEDRSKYERLQEMDTSSGEQTSEDEDQEDNIPEHLASRKAELEAAEEAAAFERYTALSVIWSSDLNPPEGTSYRSNTDESHPVPSFISSLCVKDDASSKPNEGRHQSCIERSSAYSSSQLRSSRRQGFQDSLLMRSLADQPNPSLQAKLGISDTAIRGAVRTSLHAQGFLRSNTRSTHWVNKDTHPAAGASSQSVSANQLSSLGPLHQPWEQRVAAGPSINRKRRYSPSKVAPLANKSLLATKTPSNQTHVKVSNNYGQRTLRVGSDRGLNDFSNPLGANTLIAKPKSVCGLLTEHYGPLSPSLISEVSQLHPTLYVYTASLIPSSFLRGRVLEVLRIFRWYDMPMLITIDTSQQPQQLFSHLDVGWLTSGTTKNPAPHTSIPLGKDGQGWPRGKIPVETVERIAWNLSRVDIANLRLVCRELEKMVSSLAFKTVVVPFRPEIYGMMAHDEEIRTKVPDNGKGKGKAIMGKDDHRLGPNARYLRVDKEGIYDGMKVFQAWGPHIRKFAMTFDVDEAILQNPPFKGRFETFHTFWGQYAWPLPHYTRYESCENLEKKADETSLMTSALSNLKHVLELALSVDGGLGWITGPDLSDRAKIFGHKPEVFGSRFEHSTAETRSRYQTWSALTAHVHPNVVRADPGLISLRTRSSRTFFPPLIFSGLDLESMIASTVGGASITTNTLIPNRLTSAQQEWLLETYWAQDAFLTSWFMAVVDNSDLFSNVHTLTISCLSSRYLKTLKRKDIWMTLKTLSSLTIMVSPDWRDVVKPNDRPVETPFIHPSFAANHFFDFLEQSIGNVEKLATLKIGYVGGGERAQGLFARNKHVLPAPIVLFDRSRMTVDRVTKSLTLPHVKHLTLSNCWVTPDTITLFIDKMQKMNLHTLVLDSVSLTAQPGIDRSNFTPADPILREVPTPPVASAMAAMMAANPILAGASPVVQLQMIQDIQESQGESSFDPFPETLRDWIGVTYRKGSWPEVINNITPGKTLDQMRFKYGFTSDEPSPRSARSLRDIDFISCGYIRFPDMTNFLQDVLGSVEINTVECLQTRVFELERVMMGTNDQYLGQIVPSMDYNEMMLLETSFGMTNGWGNDVAKWETREDGQPMGGSGRFSGSLKETVNGEHNEKHQSTNP